MTAIANVWAIGQDHEKNHDLMWSGYTKLPYYTGLVYRFTKLNEITLEALDKSLNKGIALSIGDIVKQTPKENEEGKPGKVLATAPGAPGVSTAYGGYTVVIYSRTGRYIFPLSQMEHEVIFMGNVQFRVWGVSKKHLVWFLEELESKK